MSDDHTTNSEPLAPHHSQPHGDGGWADTPTFKKWFLRVLIGAGVLSALAGFVPAFQKDHPHFALERIPVFFALWGFGAFIFIVLVGQHLRKLVGRDEQYYEDRE